MYKDEQVPGQSDRGQSDQKEISLMKECDWTELRLGWDEQTTKECGCGSKRRVRKERRKEGKADQKRRVVQKEISNNLIMLSLLEIN